MKLRGCFVKDFRQLFLEELKDVYSAEKQIDEVFPELIQAAKSQKLKDVLEEHHLEVQKHIEILERVGEEVGSDFAGAECDAMRGMIKECRKVLKMNYFDQVLDAAIIGLVQRIEHYEIAIYGVLKAFARHLHLKEVEMKLGAISKEECRLDKKLTELAEGTLFGGGINGEASKRISA